MNPSHVHFPIIEQFAALWAPFLPTLQIHRFDKGHAILRHGDGAQVVWLVTEGWVSLVRHTPDGRETIVGLCTTSDLFGEAALFPNANYPYTAQVLQDDTQVVAIPANTLRQIRDSDPAFAAFLMKMLNDRINRTQLKLEHMTSLCAAQRLGCFLLRLCEQRQETRNMVMPIDKQAIASYLGMKPETLSRSFQQLSPLGIEVQHAVITVSDVPRLVDYVCNSCSEAGLCETESNVIALED